MAYIMDSPFKSISILYRKSHIWLNNGCAQYHLTAAQAVVILIVCDFNVLTQDEITKRLSLDKSVIAKTVTKLEETGFLVRTTNARDKRTYDIRPTEKAWNVYPFVKEQVEESFRHMTQQMTDAEREEFKRLLLLAADASLALDD
ncbi:MarR family winged helix-turn-helix transcriptional regulator [Dysosmobacter sp.]|uniref:MarR family winged helix-turn-helix transcriptional regulator n=1 Tax=Dysosmobacter sp. TaxID=2591382 RepID=UPI003A8EA993